MQTSDTTSPSADTTRKNHHGAVSRGLEEPLVSWPPGILRGLGRMRPEVSGHELAAAFCTRSQSITDRLFVRLSSRQTRVFLSRAEGIFLREKILQSFH